MEMFTVGHSTHSEERFVGLLQRHGITAVADVRSSPRSRLEHFSRGPLSAILARAEIRYVFLGKELGARPADRSCYRGPRASYRLIAQTALFASGIERLVDGAKRERIALMCAEKDPLTCHRTVLVGRQLVDRGLDLLHILATGDLESHEQATERLLKEVGFGPDRDLFRSQGDLIAEAYDRRAQDIEFVEAGAFEGASR